LWAAATTGRGATTGFVIVIFVTVVFVVVRRVVSFVAAQVILWNVDRTGTFWTTNTLTCR
jgi:hypothetical protein